MKITINGKAGEGKTTLAALISNMLAKAGYTVVVDDGYLTEECDPITGETVFGKIQDRENTRLEKGIHEPREVGIKVVQRKENPKPLLKAVKPLETLTKDVKVHEKDFDVPIGETEGEKEPKPQETVLMSDVETEERVKPNDWGCMPSEDVCLVHDEPLVDDYKCCEGKIEAVEPDEVPTVGKNEELNRKKSCLPWKK